MEPEPLASPRLATLQRAIASGDQGALEAFWHDITSRGTPLIEPDPNDAGQVLVTLLWRAGDEIHNVAILGGFKSYFELASNQLSRLPATDVWYRTDRARADARSWYRVSPNDSLEPPRDWATRTPAFIADPLNPRHFTVLGGPDNPITSHTEIWSVIEPPGATPQPWIPPRPDVPVGRVEEHRILSAMLGGERQVWVYIPAGYKVSHGPCNLLLLLDGFIYARVIPTPTILDNLIADGRIPPTIALMVNNPSMEARIRELSCHAPFVDFLAEELLPWVRQAYRVTTDPRCTIVGGSSLGGLSAAFAALRRPDAFGNVLSQSGSFWWKPQGEAESGWLAREYAAAPNAALRFYLDVGCLEGRGQRRANEEMRNLLRAHGATVHYQEFGGGHTFLCWQGTLADAIASRRSD